MPHLLFKLGGVCGVDVFFWGIATSATHFLVKRFSCSWEGSIETPGYKDFNVYCIAIYSYITFVSHAYFINIIACTYKAYTLMGLCATFCHSQGWCFRKGRPLSANLLFHWLTVLPIIWIGDVWFWLQVFWGWLYRQVDTSQRSWHTNSIQWNLVLILRLTSRSVTPRPVVQIGKKLPKIPRIFFPEKSSDCSGAKIGSKCHPFHAGRLGCLHPMACVGSLSATSRWSQGGKVKTYVRSAIGSKKIPIISIGDKLINPHSVGVSI